MRTNGASGMTLGEAWATLGLSGPAAPETVTTAFRAAVKAARPDHGGDPERFRRVIEAYRLLQNAQAARAALAPPERTGTPAETKPEPVLAVTLAEALEGLARNVRLPDGRTLGLRLPAGLRPGETVRLKGQGEGGRDLKLTVTVTCPEGVRLIGDDLWIEAGVPPRRLADGGRHEVETPRGARTIWIPRGLGDAPVLRLKGEGLPARGLKPRGHLFVRLVPAEDEAAESPAREMLRRFAEAWTEGARAASRL